MKKFTISLLITLVSASIIAHRVSASELTIEGNGQDSTSDIAISATQQTTVNQSNVATYTNDVVVATDTGENVVSDNTSENTTVQTGDSSISEKIENSGNISVDGAVLSIPSALTVPSACCGDQLSIDIANNGADTANSVAFEQTLSTHSSSQNVLTIKNLIEGNAITGDNKASGNTGNVSVQTGAITVHENILNDQINLTSASGSSHSTDSGTTISIRDNGSGSSNTISASFENTDSFLVTDETNIVNNSSWDLVTGNNLVLHNVGNIDVETGDIVFDSVIRNGPVNINLIKTGCCKDIHHDPQGPNAPIGQGGLSDPDLPTGTTPPSSVIASVNASGESGKTEEKNTDLLAGNMLPATGGWLYLAIACNIFLLLIGVFLRLRSGRSPNTYSYTFAS